MNKRDQYFQGNVVAADMQDLVDQLNKLDLILLSYTQAALSEDYVLGSAVPSPTRILKSEFRRIHEYHLQEMERLKLEIPEAATRAWAKTWLADFLASKWANTSTYEKSLWRGAGIALGLSSGLLIGLWWAAQSVPVDPEKEHVLLLHSTIFKQGMPRSEVELRFRRSTKAVQTSTMTVYIEPPDLLYDVPYDSTGGLWNGENKINGMVVARAAELRGKVPK